MMAIHKFDKDLEKANKWLKDIQDKTRLSESEAFSVFKGTLHELRDRLTPIEGAHFASELPRIIRGLFYEQWNPKNLPIKYNKSEFISRIHSYTGNDPNIIPESLVKDMFEVLKNKISQGEINDVKNLLPLRFQELFN
ncbi:MAG: DUF2267 domain-containing protein [Nanoarchaeota archaeon]